MDLQLTNRVAIVTGGSQGIGKACAAKLAQEGATVVIAARGQELLDQVAGEIRAAGGKIMAIAADVSKDADCARLIQETLKAYGRIDILINNTGGPSAGPIETADPLAFQAVFSQHLVCNHILAQAVIPAMKQNGWGRIINVISTSVRIPIDNLGVSNTIRAAVASWSKTMSNELAVHGITVNSLLPGFISTARLEAVAENFAARANIEKAAMQAQMRASVPAKRFGSPAEIAAVAAFVASPAASYLNGICIPVDGGRTGSI